MVAQVAALAENGGAARVLASEVQLDPLGVLVPHLDYFVPVRRDSFKLLHKRRGVHGFEHSFHAGTHIRLVFVRLRLSQLK